MSQPVQPADQSQLRSTQPTPIDSASANQQMTDSQHQVAPPGGPPMVGSNSSSENSGTNKDIHRPQPTTTAMLTSVPEGTVDIKDVTKDVKMLASTATASSTPTATAMATATGESATVVVDKATVECCSEYPALGCTELRSGFMSLVSLRAPALRQDHRAPADVVLVVDRSGSISEVMPLIQKVLKFVVDRQMMGRDRLSIVSYSDNCRVDLPLTVMDAAGKSLAHKGIDRLAASGGTDIGQALIQGMQILREARSPAPIQALLLLTDGRANEGSYQKTEDLVRCVNGTHWTKVTNACLRRSTVNLQPTPKSPEVVWEWLEVAKDGRRVWTSFPPETVKDIEFGVELAAPLLRLEKDHALNKGSDQEYIVLQDNAKGMHHLNLTNGEQHSIRRIVEGKHIQTTLAEVNHARKQAANSSSSSSRTKLSGGPFGALASAFGSFGSFIGSIASSSASSADAQPAPTPITVVQRHSSAHAHHMTDKTDSKTDSKSPSKADTSANSKADPSAESKAGERSAPTVYTFGFTPNVDTACMQAIAEAGNGMYAFIEHESKIGEAFAQCLGGVLSVMMQRINVWLRPVRTDGRSVVQRVITAYPTLTDPKTTDTKVTIPDMQSEETRDLLLELDVPECSAATDSHGLVDVEVEYYNVVTKAQDTIKTRATIQRLPANDPRLASMKPSIAVDAQRNRVNANAALQLSIQLGEQGKFTEASTLLENAINRIQRSVSANDPLCKGLVEDLRRALAGVADDRAFRGGGSHAMSSITSSHSHQRSTTGACYMSKARKTAIDKCATFLKSNP